MRFALFTAAAAAAVFGLAGSMSAQASPVKQSVFAVQRPVTTGAAPVNLVVNPGFADATSAPWSNVGSGHGNCNLQAPDGHTGAKKV